MLRDLFTAAFKLDDEQRKRTVRIAVGLAVLCILVVLALAGRTAASEPGVEHPVWEIAILYRLALARLLLAFGLVQVGAMVGMVLYQAFENTQLGKRLVIWSETDSEPVKARKTGNAGLLAGVAFLSCILGLLVGVLR
jgi:cytochrome c biogenesis protein CcdA